MPESSSKQLILYYLWQSRATPLHSFTMNEWILCWKVSATSIAHYENLSKPSTHVLQERAKNVQLYIN